MTRRTQSYKVASAVRLEITAAGDLGISILFAQASDVDGAFVDKTSPPHTSLSPATRVIVVGMTGCPVVEAVTAAVARRQTVVAIDADGSRSFDLQNRDVIVVGAEHWPAAARMLNRVSTHWQRRLIVLLAILEESAALALAETDVADFAIFPCASTELVARIARIARIPRIARRDWRSPDIAPMLLSSADPPAATELELTAREARVYEALAWRVNEVVSRAELIEIGWRRGAAFGPSSNVIEVYVRYLRGKLARHAPHFTIATVRGVGYCLRHSESACELL